MTPQPAKPPHGALRDGKASSTAGKFSILGASRPGIPGQRQRPAVRPAGRE